MKIKLLALLISLPVLVGAVASLGAETETRSLTIKPLFDLRIRQEILDGVYHFDPVEQDRNWVRYRTRAGAHLTSGDHEVQLRLANENRSYLTPDDVDHDWDEVIIDRAQWTWHASESTRLDVGRQDIVWDDGFLMLDPHPLDGSRSMYHTAVRLRTKRDHTDLDVSLIHNPRRDHLVLIDDQERALCDADETAVAVHVSAADWRFSGIWKYEDFTGDLFPLTTWTLGLRREGDLGRSGRFRVEAAVQYQDFDLSDQPSGGLLRDEDYDGWAFALQAFGRAPIAARTDLEAGVFYYSGADQGSQRAFRTPWGRWPKWSDLYIYTLIGESTPGRVHVAAWENIAAPRVDPVSRAESRYRRTPGGDLPDRARTGLGRSWPAAADRSYVRSQVRTARAAGPPALGDVRTGLLPYRQHRLSDSGRDDPFHPLATDLRLK